MFLNPTTVFQKYVFFIIYNKSVSGLNRLQSYNRRIKMEKNSLKKSISFWGIIAMATGSMVCAWMVDIKYWFEITGISSALGLLVAGLLFLPLCLIFSENNSMLPYAGGPNIWVSNCLGWDVGWFTCWFQLMLYVALVPANAYVCIGLFGWFVPLTPSQTRFWSGVFVVVWYLLMHVEMRFLSRIQTFVFWSTLVVALGASVIFIFNSNWSLDIAKPVFSNGTAGFATIIGILVLKFIGFDMIAELTEEAKFPPKKIWATYLISMGFTVLVYGMAVIGVGGHASRAEIMEMAAVDPTIASKLGMHWLGVLLVIMGIGTVMTSIMPAMASASRILYGASKQYQFSPVFSKLTKSGQPWVANLAVGIAGLYFTVMAPDEWINYIYTITGLLGGIVYLMVTISFIGLRKTHPDWERPYKIKYPKIVFVLSSLFMVYVIYICCKEMDPGSWLTLGLLFILGIGCWIYAKFQQKRDPEKWKKFIINPENTPINNTEEDGE